MDNLKLTVVLNFDENCNNTIFDNFERDKEYTFVSNGYNNMGEVFDGEKSLGHYSISRFHILLLGYKWNCYNEKGFFSYK